MCIHCRKEAVLYNMLERKKNNSLMNLIWNFKASDIICLYITSWPSSSVRRKKEALINSQGRTENII